MGVSVCLWRCAFADPFLARRSPLKRTLIDRDALNGAPKKTVADLCVLVFDRIQQRKKEHQLLALASAFTLLCDACKIPPQDVFAATKNLMADPLTSTGLAPQFQAMRFHLNTEVLA